MERKNFRFRHNYVGADRKSPDVKKRCNFREEGEDCGYSDSHEGRILLGKGLGNTEWNESAPHGSGRIMNREEIRKHHTVSQFKAEMKGIYCSCIGKEILDEAPLRIEEWKRL